MQSIAVGIRYELAQIKSYPTLNPHFGMVEK